jgi:phospholipase C
LRPPGATPFDHTSIIATLRERFGIAAPLTNRDAAAPHVGAALSLPTPSNNGPNTLTALPYITTPKVLANAQTATLNGHQQGLLQLAAHLPATTSTGNFETFIGSFIAHLESGTTGTNTSGIQTVADAAGFIKSRMGSLFRSL